MANDFNMKNILEENAVEEIKQDQKIDTTDVDLEFNLTKDPTKGEELLEDVMDVDAEDVRMSIDSDIDAQSVINQEWADDKSIKEFTGETTPSTPYGKVRDALYSTVDNFELNK